MAEEAKLIWRFCKNTEEKRIQKWNILTLAKGYGFFSIWMMVFSDDTEIKNALIETFPGTSKECFDQNGMAIHRKGGRI